MRHFEISLRDMRFYARHGVFGQEQTVGNEFAVDLTVDIPYDGRIAGANACGDGDPMAHTVSYADLHDIVCGCMATPTALLETLAARMADSVTRRFPQVKGGRVSITKISPPIASATGSATVTLFF